MNAQRTILAALAAVICVPFLRAAPPLFENGRTAWKVVLPDDAPPPVAFAAQELTNALTRVSGAAFAIVPSREGEGPFVRFATRDDRWDDEKVAYNLVGDDLVFGGNQPRAALHAVYAFLQRELDVRWLWPGEDGAFFPPRASWSFPKNFGFKHTPSIRYRGFHHCGDWRDRDAFNLWQTRNFAVIHRHGVWSQAAKFGQYNMLSTHNANLNGDKELFAEHPECYCLIGGKRYMFNICFSSDLAAEKVAEKLAKDLRRRASGVPVDILSIFPNDNQDYCQCDACKAKGVSTAWFSFYGKLVEILSKEFPDLRFATIAYQGYRDVPGCAIPKTEFVEYASHGRCHIHLWGDKSCGSNVSELKRFEDWRARGGVPLGHYAYEYDAISRHGIFMPFFSMIGDVLETGVRLGVVSTLPEVSLSPKNGPEIKVHAVQNRLTILYYAWKMWDVSLTLDDFLEDISRHAFGPAAAPMKEYFLLLDKAWGQMEGRISLFADGMNVAGNLFRDEATPRGAAALLAKAEKLAANDARALGNVLREKALFQQMLDYRELKSGAGPAINLPRLDEAAPFGDGAATWHPLRKADGADGGVRVRGCWRTRTVVSGKSTKTTAAALAFEFDGATDAAVAIETDSGARLLFAFKDGKTRQRMVSDVGVEATNWQPEWSAAKEGGRLVFRIPAEILPQIPSSGDSWHVRLASGNASLPFKPDTSAQMNFIPSAAADRPIAFYPCDSNLPRLANTIRAIPSLRNLAVADGWKLVPCTNREEFAAAAAAPGIDTFLLATPIKGGFTPEAAEALQAKVKAGGTLIARSWWTIPLDVILGDPAVKCHCAAPKDYPLGDRHAKWVRDGDWLKKPWDIEGNIRRTFSPCYMQVPDAPEGAWVEYASMPSKDDESKMIPFLSAMRYGKGVIIIVGESLNASHFRLIDNIRADLGLK